MDYLLIFSIVYSTKCPRIRTPFSDNMDKGEQLEQPYKTIN